MNTKVLTFLILSFTSAAFSEDFKTLNGKQYKDATVSRVEPDGIVLIRKSGVAKVYFTDLPKDVQVRFGYDPEKATAYSASQAANYAAYQKQQEEAAQRQREEVVAKNKAILGEQKPHGTARPLRSASGGRRHLAATDW